MLDGRRRRHIKNGAIAIYPAFLARPFFSPTGRALRPSEADAVAKLLAEPWHAPFPLGNAVQPQIPQLPKVPRTRQCCYPRVAEGVGRPNPPQAPPKGQRTQPAQVGRPRQGPGTAGRLANIFGDLKKVLPERPLCNSETRRWSLSPS